jgi:protein-S-isoprenylcysteine O-methyltransferase Ste14
MKSKLPSPQWLNLFIWLAIGPHFEEAELEERFSTEYVEYKRKVRRWI